MRKSSNIKTNKSNRDRTKCSTVNNKQRVEEQGEVVGSTSNLSSCSGHNLTENHTVSNPNHGASTTGTASPGTALHSPGKARAQLPSDKCDGVRVRTRRYPHCSRCRSHGLLVPIKGHKKFCDWKNCKCHNCQLITARQKLMAKVIALHRQQDMEAMANLQQLATASHSVAGEEVPDLEVTIVSPNNSVPPSTSPILSSLPPGTLVTNNQGIPQTHSLQVGPHSSIQYQWNGNNSTHYSPVIDNEIHIPVPQSSETDFSSPIYGTSLASHGRSGSLGPMMAYTPYSKCSHQQLPFPFGLVSSPKLSTATSQIYSPNFLFYQQQQQQQQQLQVQMPQYRFQGNSFGACVGDGQGAFLPVGQQNPATHHSAFAPEDSPSPSEMTSADAFDEVAVLEVEASEIHESANHTLRIPVSSRTMHQAFLPASTKDISTMSDFHSLLGPPSTTTEPRAFIPLQNALFPHKHSQDKN